ncbi:MAG TPA: alpha-galactosidase [Propionibacteriaceae bacterium]|nr:alpha-galactosidase [Propionibacteriaceae bacterium]
MTTSPEALVVLRTDGVCVLIKITDGQLPSIVHWGDDLGEVTEEDFQAIAEADIPPNAPNLVDATPHLAVLPEHWTGWTGRLGLSGSREGRDWSPRFETTVVRVDGEEVSNSAGATPLVARGQAAVVVEAVDVNAALALRVTLELTAGGLLRSRAEVTNTGPETYAVDDLALAYPVPTHARELLDFAGRWGKERTPQRSDLVTGVHLRQGRRGRTGADAATVLHLGTPGFGFAEGEIWSVHTGWSGNHTHYAERLSTGEQVLGGGELLLPGEVRLAQGESYQSPWLYGSYGHGLDEVARRFHTFLRSRDRHPAIDRPVTLNVWEAVYFDHDLSRLSDLAERAAALGVERYVLDDGWFGARRHDRAGLGDWTVSKEVWPDGLHPLIDKVTGLGMQFGLWFEPEMVNPDSDVARAHPEWLMATGGRMPVLSRHQQVLNLGIGECYAYIRDAMMAILDEYDISYIKWDHNRDLIDAGTAPSGRPGVHEQTLAFYRLVDELRAAHPTLEIESCSSGGARVDLGVLVRTDRVWVSDCIDPLDRQQMNRWTTQLVPPEMMGSHIASGRSHTTGRVHDLAFRAASAVFGHLGIEWDLAVATEPELSELHDWIAFFKAERQVLLGGDLIRLDFPDPSISAHGVVSKDRSRAIYEVAAIAQSEAVSVGRLRLRGLDPHQRYLVKPVLPGGAPEGMQAPPWWHLDQGLQPTESTDSSAGPPEAAGAVFTGAALVSVGLRAPGLRPDQAALFVVEAVG